jgi:hypothetical protein
LRNLVCELIELIHGLFVDIFELAKLACHLDQLVVELRFLEPLVPARHRHIASVQLAVRAWERERVSQLPSPSIAFHGPCVYSQH